MYVYGENAAGTKQYYLFNGHGDVVQLTGLNGIVTKRYDYDAFGNEKAPDVNDTNVFRYCGEYFDKETGTIYLRARYYDPTIGRFVTEDSYWGKDSDPLSLNLYTFAHNNPILYIDPSGFKIELSSNATDEQKQEYNRAIAYLKTSEDGKALIEKLVNSEEVFTISFDTEATAGSKYIPVVKTISWAYLGGLVMSDGTSVMSPAMSLAHEMGHGAQDLDGELDGKTRSQGEAANLKKYETSIAKQLGEPTRSSYNSVKVKRRMNNSIHFITTYSYGLGFYINPNNWGKSNKYTVQHNRYPIIGTSIRSAE